MKFNKNRVIKCLTCLATVCMVVLTALVTPVNAATFLDPSDHLVEVTIDGNTKTAHYSFEDLDWLITAWNSTTGLYEDFHNDVKYFPDVNFKQAIFQAYPFGGPVYGDTIPWNGVAFDVSDILPGSAIDFEFPLYIRAIWNTFEQVDVSVSCTYGMAYYDKNGTYLNTIYGETKKLDFSMESIVSKEWEEMLVLSGSIPAVASYIVPFAKVDTVLSVYVPDMQIHFGGIGFDLYVDVNTILENSNMMHSINNKLDSIISGTPEQNESADGFNDVIKDQAGQIQDSLDVMDSVQKPDVSGVQTSVDSFVPKTDMLAYTTPLTMFWKNTTLTAMLVLVVTLAMVSFVFFGKKG